MKKVIAMIIMAAMLLGLAGCAAPAAEAETVPAEEAAVEEAAVEAETTEGESYTVGICQLVQHAALDAATQGFKDVLAEKLGDSVTIEEANASNDIPTCATICNGFAASEVDLIMANATPALQAAAAATNTIPVLGTSVTEYGVALNIENFTGVVGTNVSGTSDLAPLDQQADMVMELIPETKTVGILYCSAEANSVYQANVVKEYLEGKGLTVNIYTFSDSNDVAAVATSACSECDALYIPTDNTAASCAEAISAVALPAGVPIIAGEEGLCSGCGLATLSIDYYELGRATGEMAVKVLKGEADIAEMEIGYAPEPTKKYNPDIASKLGIEIPAEYVAIGE